MRRRHQPEPLLDGPQDSGHGAAGAVDGRSAPMSLIPTVPLGPPVLFPPVAQRCDSFSQWWRHAVRGVGTASELLAVNEVAAW
jgi:hypothetical protein